MVSALLVQMPVLGSSWRSRSQQTACTASQVTYARHGQCSTGACTCVVKMPAQCMHLCCQDAYVIMLPWQLVCECMPAYLFAGL
jgi:hypothetical protein